MAGHSKFKNIQFRKGAQDKKRAKVFTKLVKEIITAAKIGGLDQYSNPRLRSVLTSARAQNLPKERIDKALVQSQNPISEDENYHEIRYEGLAAGGVPIIVEALTDNKNRTAGEVRAAFTKYGGKLGEKGSVSFMFDNVGIIEYSLEKTNPDEIFAIAIDANALDVVANEESYIIYTEKENFIHCLDILVSKFGEPEESSIGWRPKEIVKIDITTQAEKIVKLVNALEDSEDVQYVYSNYEFNPDIYEEINKYE